MSNEQREQRELRFFVAGIPKPAGSKTPQTYRRKDGSLVMRENGSVLVGMRDASGKAGSDWRKTVKDAAKVAMIGQTPFTGPLKLALYFEVPRPKTHYGSGKNANVIKPSAPKYPTSKPDTTKLLRSVEDALTAAGVWIDDAQVTQQFASKDYVLTGTSAGVHVTIRELISPWG